MKLKLSYLLALTGSLALVSAAPTVLITIQEGLTHSQNQLHELEGDVHATCSGLMAPCITAGWPTSYCCGDLKCSQPNGGFCIPTH